MDHHDLLPDILSQSITYILNINLPRVELRSHLAAALHAVPPGVAHQSQNNIRVVMHHLDQQPSPKRHHQELIQYLRYHLREHRAFVGHAAFHQRTPTPCWQQLASVTSSSYHLDTNQSYWTSSSRRVSIFVFYIKQQHRTSRTSTSYWYDMHQ